MSLSNSQSGFIAALFNIESIASLLGIVILVVTGAALLRAWKTRWWRRAKGLVIEAGLRERRQRDKYGCRIIDPVIRYAYSVNGVEFTSKTVSLSRTVTASADGRPLTRVYPVGTEVTVYHHPSNWNIATLLHTPVLARSAVLVLAVMWTAVFGLMSWRRVQSAASDAGPSHAVVSKDAASSLHNVAGH